MPYAEKKTFKKMQATYKITKKVIQVGGIVDELKTLKRLFHGGTSRKQCENQTKK